ncbi:MAG: hypothetical protein ACRDJK_07075, partial [Actinomycetota bacterium]
MRDPYLDPHLFNAGPLELTRPEYGVVPFQERDELRALLHWCEEPGPFAPPRIAVVHGAGGTGKTHLLAELADQLREAGWVAGLLPKTGADPSWLGTLVSPLFVGVDYADARLPDTIALLSALRHRPAGPTCVVLTARGISGWWEELEKSLRDEGHPYQVAAHTALPRQHWNYRRVYGRAKAAFAKGSDPPPGEDVPPLRPPLWTTLDYVLLAWLDARSDEPLPETRDELYDKVLEHEADYWQKALATLRRCEVTQIPDPHRALLTGAAACLTLVTPVPGRVADLLRAIRRLDEQLPLADELEHVLDRCLGRTPGEPMAIRPDSVGDHLAAKTFTADPELLVALLRRASSDERIQAMANLTRASLDRAEAVSALLARALDQVDDLWPAAVVVASTLGGPLPGLLDELVARRHPRFPPELLAQAPSLGNLPTRKLALTVAEAVLERTSGPEQRAQALNNLANSQSAVGMRTEALPSITEAVELYRRLARDNPAAFLPDLATSLNNLAPMQSEVGMRAEALSSITEAVELYRRLARDNPAAFLPDLAMSLNNLAPM